jgi:RteC protein.
MDITTYCENLNSRMQERLILMGQDAGDLVKISQTLTFLRGLIGELKSFVRTYRFTSDMEEVRFFKEQKPTIVVQYLYYKKVFAVRLFDSFNDATARANNYSAELRRMEVFIRKNVSFYEYCLSGSTYLDKEYFQRGSSAVPLLTFDETFSTGYDGKLAKILANELLRTHVNSLQARNASSNAASTLTWTGTKTDLIELVYALQAAGVVDQGNATIKTIACTMEAAFNITLGDTYRVFQDIRIRKKSQTPFIDLLKKSIMERLNDL